jgi:hypothetical protein
MKSKRECLLREVSIYKDVFPCFLLTKSLHYPISCRSKYINIFISIFNVMLFGRSHLPSVASLRASQTTFYFKKEIFGHCVLKEKCTKQERRTATIGKHHEPIMEAEEYNKTQNFKDDMKERSHIEPKHAEVK